MFRGYVINIAIDQVLCDLDDSVQFGTSIHQRIRPLRANLIGCLRTGDRRVPSAAHDRRNAVAARSTRLARHSSGRCAENRNDEPF